jgi:hypothetical protein
MSSVFISYAREDQAVVRRLHGALHEFGHEAWVDWEGIPPSAVWMAEIRKAIEAADAFVFVISPDSLSSGACREEIAHAASVNKRLVPVVHREADGVPVPEPLSALNWIFLRDDEEFEAGIDALLRALETDLDWVADHTRLLTRAREWEQRGHPASLLLRGDDLREAERWLATAAGRTPEPTPLHAELIVRSRRSAASRQRLTTGAVAFALVVSVVLSGFALVQRSTAVRERERAERQARISRSRELAALAAAQLEIDPELAVLLALEAADVAPTAEAEQTLRRSIVASNVRATLAGHTGAVVETRFSPDGAHLLTAGFDGVARIWDTATGETIAVLEGHRAPITAAAFSPTGDRIVTASEDGTARLWDAAGGSIAVLRGHEGALTTAGFDPTGSLVVTAAHDGTVRSWDAADGATSTSCKRGTRRSWMRRRERTGWSPRVMPRGRSGSGRGPESPSSSRGTATACCRCRLPPTAGIS